MGSYRLRIDSVQPPGDRSDQPDDDVRISIADEIAWPMPRRRSLPPVGKILAEHQAAELNRAFLQAVAEALAEIDDDGGVHHE